MSLLNPVPGEKVEGSVFRIEKVPSVMAAKVAQELHSYMTVAESYCYWDNGMFFAVPGINFTHGTERISILLDSMGIENPRASRVDKDWEIPRPPLWHHRGKLVGQVMPVGGNSRVMMNQVVEECSVLRKGKFPVADAHLTCDRIRENNRSDCDACQHLEKGNSPFFISGNNKTPSRKGGFVSRSILKSTGARKMITPRAVPWDVASHFVNMCDGLLLRDKEKILGYTGKRWETVIQGCKEIGDFGMLGSLFSIPVNHRVTTEEKKKILFEFLSHTGIKNGRPSGHKFCSIPWTADNSGMDKFQHFLMNSFRKKGIEAFREMMRCILSTKPVASYGKVFWVTATEKSQKKMIDFLRKMLGTDMIQESCYKRKLTGKLLAIDPYLLPFKWSAATKLAYKDRMRQRVIGDHCATTVLTSIEKPYKVRTFAEVVEIKMKDSTCNMWQADEIGGILRWILG